MARRRVTSGAALAAASRAREHRGDTEAIGMDTGTVYLRSGRENPSTRRQTWSGKDARLLGPGSNTPASRYAESFVGPYRCMRWRKSIRS
jgi:hypothetical protein